jgi:hypothetical protein
VEPDTTVDVLHPKNPSLDPPGRPGGLSESLKLEASYFLSARSLHSPTLPARAMKSWNRSQNGVLRTNGHARQRRNSASVGDGGVGGAMGLPSPAAGGGPDYGAGPERNKIMGMGWLRRASFVEPAVALMSPMVNGSLFHGGGGGGGGGGAGGSEAPPGGNYMAPFAMSRTAWRHKYLEGLEFDTYIQPGGARGGVCGGKGREWRHRTIGGWVERTEAKQGAEPGERDDPFTYQIITK